MGLRVRKSIKLAPGVRVNLGKKGASLSVGGKGATLNVGKKGVRGTVGIPGSGLSYSAYEPYKSTKPAQNLPNSNPSKAGFIFSCVCLVFIVGIVVAMLVD